VTLGCCHGVARAADRYREQAAAFLAAAGGQAAVLATPLPAAAAAAAAASAGLPQLAAAAMVQEAAAQAIVALSNMAAAEGGGLLPAAAIEAAGVVAALIDAADEPVLGAHALCALGNLALSRDSRVADLLLATPGAARVLTSALADGERAAEAARTVVAMVRLRPLALRIWRDHPAILEALWDARSASCYAPLALAQVAFHRSANGAETVAPAATSVVGVIALARFLYMRRKQLQAAYKWAKLLVLSLLL
jgi:hypothetical protein